MLSAESESDRIAWIEWIKQNNITACQDWIDTKDLLELEVFKASIHDKCDITYRFSYQESLTLFQFACLLKRYEIATKLISLGADIKVSHALPNRRLYSCLL